MSDNLKQIEAEIIEPCEKCKKMPNLCVCEAIDPVATKTHVLILQHPQEKDRNLGSAYIAHLSLPNSTFKIGLSWRNLKALIKSEVNPKQWLVLFLGTAKVKKDAQEMGQKLVIIDRKNNPLENSKNILKGIKGLIVLDGNWSQSKALWWRNAWLLKVHRGILFPEKRSLYGRYRKEPREESISTIEAISEALSYLEKEDISENLLKPFKKLIEKYTLQNKR
ncbi:MAG: tRNA-uridine aminocarboxypropyltransferase [bacterium]|nr:tRNA-uridine aminocarboxypropyltransferase [bacterium]